VIFHRRGKARFMRGSQFLILEAQRYDGACLRSLSCKPELNGLSV